MNNDQHDFEQFMKQRSEVALAYMRPVGSFLTKRYHIVFSGGL
jgi:hypothetical protein